MLTPSNPPPREGLGLTRLMMVLSSFSPLFILWAIRGNSFFPTQWFIIGCAIMILIPNSFLSLRLRIAKKNHDKRSIKIGTADDHRDHILVYLFAMLLPFYSEDLDTPRNLIATIAALAFIVFLFWHLNLHYMNLAFALQGYRVFTAYPPPDENPLTGKDPVVVITRRVSFAPNAEISVYRLSDTVYLESI